MSQRTSQPLRASTASADSDLSGAPVTRRISGIDEWRGVLVLVVILTHFFGFKFPGFTFRQPYTIAHDLRAAGGNPPLAFAGLIDQYVDSPVSVVPVQGWAIEDWKSTTGPRIAEVRVKVGDAPEVAASLGQPTPGLASSDQSLAKAGWVVAWDRGDATPGEIPVEVHVRTEGGSVQSFRGSLTYLDRGSWPWNAMWLPIFAQVALDHFFLVSGFLITLILVRTKGLPGFLRIFWARRALRILPLALACIGAVALIDPESRPRLLPYLFFYSNYTPEHVGALSPMWSLAVEEQFYLLVPILFWLVPRERLWQLVGLLVLVLTATRLGFPSAHMDGIYVTSSFTHVRAIAIALGSWMALVREGLVPRPRLAALVFLGWAAALLVGGDTSTLFTRSATRIGLLDPVGIGAALLILWLVVRAPRRRIPLLRFIGIRCYGFYLLHLPMLMLIQARAPALSPPLFAAAWLVSLTAVVELSYRLLERPLIALAPDYPSVAGNAPEQEPVNLRRMVAEDS